MKILKNWKKTAAVMAAGLMLTSSFTTPVMAHGHHSGSHHGSIYTGTYCSYHDTVHKKASNCTRYCTKHHKTHANGKCH